MKRNGREIMASKVVATLMLLAMLTEPAMLWAKNPSLTRTGDVNRPIEQVFSSLKDYFNDAVHQWRLVQTDDKSRKIVASRTVTDSQSWGEDALCKVEGINLLNTFQSGEITVTLALSADGKNQTHIKLTPLFTAHYTLGGAKQDVLCQSRGVLEPQILEAAGVPADEAD